MNKLIFTYLFFISNLLSQVYPTEQLTFLSGYNTTGFAQKPLFNNDSILTNNFPNIGDSISLHLKTDLVLKGILLGLDQKFLHIKQTEKDRRIPLDFIIYLHYNNNNISIEQIKKHSHIESLSINKGPDSLSLAEVYLYRVADEKETKRKIIGWGSFGFFYIGGITSKKGQGLDFYGYLFTAAAFTAGYNLLIQSNAEDEKKELMFQSEEPIEVREKIAHQAMVNLAKWAKIKRYSSAVLNSALAYGLSQKFSKKYHIYIPLGIYSLYSFIRPSLEEREFEKYIQEKGDLNIENNVGINMHLNNRLIFSIQISL